MHLTSCLNPIRIVNPYTHKVQYVPCGTCAYCRSSKQSLWVQRIRQESLCWKYCIFFTLTYDEKSVPRLYLNDDDTLVDPDSGFVVDPTLIDGFDSRSRLFLHKCSNITYVRKRDIQLFVKKLRYYIHNLHRHSNEIETLRYYIIGEYGSTTLRAHYHGLLWFNSSVTAEKIATLLSKSWSYGLLDWSVARDAASYVAQYLNCSYSLPKVYLHPDLRPFALFSKCPPIGSLVVADEEIKEIFHAGAIQRSIYERKSNRYVDIPLWRSLQDRLFPVVANFNDLTHYDRVAVYGIAKFSCAETWKEFVEWCNVQIQRSLSFGLTYGFWKYLEDTLSRCYKSGCYSHYPLMRLWSISRRVLLQCQIFDCTLDYYVSRIELYYSNKDYYRLVKQMEFEVDFARRYGAQSLIYLDMSFVDNFYSRYKNRCNGIFDISASDRLLCESFGVDPLRLLTDRDYVRSLDPFSHPSYRSFLEKYEWIQKCNSKTKVKNDYLRLHPEYRVLIY